MLKVEKNNREWGAPIIKIANDVNKFEIIFGGNGDLYFKPVMTRMELFEKGDPIYFVINKEDPFLFESFNRLYSKIINYSAFDSDDNSTVEDRRKEDSYRDYPLVNNGTVSWHSDEDMSEIASVLNIRRLDDGNLQLEFIKNRPENTMYMTYSIRFRNSGSTYNPFNFRFMELYNNLCAYYANEKEEEAAPTKIYK